MIESIHQSHIGMFYRCPAQFEFRYMQDIIIPPGIAARIGSGFHKGAEVNHKAKLVTCKDEPLSVCQDAGRDEYYRLVKERGVFFPPDEKGTAKKQLVEGIDTTVGLIEVYHDKLAPSIQPELVEERISFEEPGIPLPLVGTVDLLAKPNWLVDLKSSAKKWPEKRIETDIQFTLYREFIKARTGVYPDKMTVEVFTKTKTKGHQTLEAKRTAADWECLKRRINAMISMIRAGNFPPCEPSFYLCNPKWCGYYRICPYVGR